MCRCLRPYVCHHEALPETDVVTTKPAFDFYMRDQIAPEEDCFDIGSPRVPF